jgi:hypothetical protein
LTPPAWRSCRFGRGQLLWLRPDVMGRCRNQRPAHSKRVGSEGNVPTSDTSSSGCPTAPSVARTLGVQFTQSIVGWATTPSFVCPTTSSRSSAKSVDDELCLLHGYRSGERIQGRSQYDPRNPSSVGVSSVGREPADSQNCSPSPVRTSITRRKTTTTGPPLREMVLMRLSSNQ